MTEEGLGILTSKSHRLTLLLKLISKQSFQKLPHGILRNSKASLHQYGLALCHKGGSEEKN